jgi:superfamily II DNA or RNA helicase
MIRRSHSHPNSSLVEHCRSVSQGMYEVSRTCLSDDYRELARHCSLWMGWPHDILKDTAAFDSHLDKRNQCPLTHHSGGGALISYLICRYSLGKNPQILKESPLRNYVPLLVFSVVASHHSSIKRVSIRDHHKDSLEEWLRSREDASTVILEKAQSLQSETITLSQLDKEIESFLDGNEKIFDKGANADGCILFSLFYLSRVFLGALTYADSVSASRQSNGIPEPESFEEYQKTEKADFSQAVFPVFNEENDLNSLRDLLQSEIVKNWENISNGKVFMLKAATGLGKTIAVSKLLSAINAKEGERRVYYLAPTTVILNQVAGEIQHFNRSETLLLHYLERTMQGGDDGDEYISVEERERRIRSLDAGLIVTTYHRLIRLLSGVGKNDCALLKGAKDSIFILDECQALTYFQFTILANIFAVMSEYSNARFVLMSATPQSKAIFERALHVLRNPLSVALQSLLPLPISESIHQARVVSKRRSIQPLNDLKSIEKLAERVCEHKRQNTEKSLLLLVNLASDAVELAKILQSDYCITANLRPKDIRTQLKKASAELRCGNPISMIATSIIQAGVDLDFDCGFIELQELRNFRQGCGRVGRNFNEERGTCEVFTFELIGRNETSSWFRQRFRDCAGNCDEAVKLEINIIIDSLQCVKDSQNVLYDHDIEGIEKKFEDQIFEIQQKLSEKLCQQLFSFDFSSFLDDDALQQEHGFNFGYIIWYLTEPLLDDEEEFLVVFTEDEQDDLFEFLNLVEDFETIKKDISCFQDRAHFYQILKKLKRQREEITQYIAPYSLHRWSIAKSYQDHGGNLKSVNYEEFFFTCLMNVPDSAYQSEDYGWCLDQEVESAGMMP